jgi:hypothetical protein
MTYAIRGGSGPFLAIIKRDSERVYGPFVGGLLGSMFLVGSEGKVGSGNGITRILTEMTGCPAIYTGRLLCRYLQPTTAVGNRGRGCVGKWVADPETSRVIADPLPRSMDTRRLQLGVDTLVLRS